MRHVLGLSIFVTATTASLAAPTEAPAKVRTIANTPRLPAEVLRQVVNPKFYKSLRISPIDGWIIVRAQLVNTRLIGARVVQSELNGAYDRLALELAENFALSGNSTIGTHNPTSPILLHLLIYKIADGKMALSFVNLDDPGGTQGFYSGSAWLAVEKNGKWTEIKSQRAGERRPARRIY